MIDVNFASIFDTAGYKENRHGPDKPDRAQYD